MAILRLIFSIQELVWFGLGAFTYFIISFSYRRLKTLAAFSKGGFTLFVLAILTFDFTVLWMYESFIENEVRAANMGLISFGALTVIFALVGYRLVKSAAKKAA